MHMPICIALGSMFGLMEHTIFLYAELQQDGSTEDRESENSDETGM